MQNALKVLSAPKKRMSSMEISNVTGKRHGDVLESIRKVLSREPYQKYVNLGYLRWKPSLEEHGGKIRH